ncbi:autotransporter outer membrane beta-barrel domain-containing protein [Caballeronia sp. LjRoot29]
MTVSGGTYTSSGGKLLIDTVLNQGGAASSSDMPVADSTTLGTKGPTQVVVKNVGGAGAVTFGNGIEVVQVTDPTHSAAGAFTLLGRVVAGPYEYKLNQGGAQSADGNWYLSSEQAPHASGSTYATYPPDPPTPPAPPTPLYRSEVAAYLANQHVAGQMFVRSHG